VRCALRRRARTHRHTLTVIVHARTGPSSLLKNKQPKTNKPCSLAAVTAAAANRTKAHPRHIGTRTALTPATSAPGPRSHRLPGDSTDAEIRSQVPSQPTAPVVAGMLNRCAKVHWSAPADNGTVPHPPFPSSRNSPSLIPHPPIPPSPSPVACRVPRWTLVKFGQFAAVDRLRRQADREVCCRDDEWRDE
jgi:hypothetical protein